MKTKFYYLILILCCFAFQNSYSATIYVNDGFTTGDVYCTAIGNDTNSGLTPALPKRTMAAAIAAATAGDTIYVDSGTYGDDSIAINKALTIIGAGTGKTIFDNGNAAQLWANITASNVTLKYITMTKYFNGNAAQAQVIHINGAYTGIVLDAIQITNCLGATTTLANVYIAGGASVLLKNSILKCSGYNGSNGGGVRVNASTLVVQNTVFKDNESASSSAVYGGAIAITGASNVTVTNSTFSGCISGNGGAIGQTGGTLSVTGSCFTDNISELDNSTDGGGAIYVSGTSNTTISNCTFSNNRATNNGLNASSADGCAIKFNTVTGTFSISTCTFTNNGKKLDGTVVTFDKGQDIYMDESAITASSISNCTFQAPISGEVNIQNNDLELTDFTTGQINSSSPVVSGGGTPFPVENVSPSSTANTSCINPNSITSCSITSVNCTTETVAPVIISCVPNKSLTCPAILPDYTNEVNAYDDCTITIVQSPAAGMLLPPGNTTVTMTVTDQNNNSTTCTFIVTVAPATAPSNFGNFASAVSISTNGGTSSTFYNTTGSGVNLIGPSDFTGTNLGTHTSNSGTLKLTGAEFKSWKNGSGNVCGGTFYYVVYPTGARPSAPSFQNFSIGHRANCVNSVFEDGLGPCNGSDQKWSTTNQNIDLTTYANGNYTLEIYYLETGSDSGGGCGTNLYINNSCNNYTATFTIGAACTTPSISANPTATQTVCKDATTTNLSVTASGTGISYQWYSNTTNSTSGGTSLGTSAQAATYTPSSATAGTTYYYCVVTGTCGTATSTAAEVVVEATTVGGTVSSNQDICSGTQPADLTLTGHTGSVVKWQKATDAAFTSPIDITNTSATLTGAAIGNLTATTYFRAVVQNGTCATANSGLVTITVPSSTWNGTAWSNGTPTLATTVTFTGNYPPTTGYTPEDLYACSVTVTNGANVVIPSGYNYTVYGKVTVDSGSTLIFNNNANLLQQTDVANTGNISMKRDTNPLMRLDYTLWSGPVTGQNLLAFSPFTYTNRFYTYNTDTNLYNAVSPSTTNFTPGVGYQIRVPNNHPTTPTIWTGTFTGVPNNGTYTTTIANLGVGKRFNMVGNPYPSPIDLFDFVGANSANITGTLYFWRKTNSTITQSVWSTWNNGTFVAASEPYVTDPNDIARNGQGFFVEASATGTAITFNNSMRVLDNANQFFRNSNPLSSNVNTIEKHRIWLNVFDSTGEFFQQAVTYTQGGTVELDAFDGRNMNNETIMFTSIIPSSADKYVIQSRPLPFDVNDMVPLSFRTDVAGTYSIGIDHKDGLFTGNTQDIFIKDNFYNTYNNLNNGAYQFTTDAGTFDNRFELRFVDAALSNNEATFSNQVIVYNSGDDVVVRSSTETIKDIKVFDVRGRLLYSKKNINSNEARIQLDVAQEMLLIEITSQEGLKTIKKVIN